MKDIPIRQEFEWIASGSMYDLNPYAVFFVYPAIEKPFRIKGGERDLKKWMEFYAEDHSYFCHSVRYVVNDERPKFKRSNALKKIKVEKTIKRCSYSVSIVSEKYKAYVMRMTEQFQTRNVMRWKLCFGFTIKCPNNFYVKFPTNRFKDNCYLVIARKPPRCFPRQLLTYCDDYLNEKFLQKDFGKINS